MTEELQDGRDVEPADGINAVARFRVLRIRLDDRDMQFWVEVG